MNSVPKGFGRRLEKLWMIEDESFLPINLGQPEDRGTGLGHSTNRGDKSTSNQHCP